VTGDHSESLVVTGSDRSDLMINWLRELLYLWHGRAKLADTITVVEISDTRIAADLRMISYDPECHLLRNEIKAVTYHQLSVENPRTTEWVATIIFDV
jgi:SHS2 domain-containing protein